MGQWDTLYLDVKLHFYKFFYKYKLRCMCYLYQFISQGQALRMPTFQNLLGKMMNCNARNESEIVQ